MAVDPELAERVSAAVARLVDARTDGDEGDEGSDGGGAATLDQRRMFGGLAFMVAGHMTVCVSGQGGLMVRVPEDDAARLAEAEHVEPMVMNGRELRAWVRVAEPALADDDALAAWVARGVDVALALPPQG
ncbi:TfoX/Sxy family protein [Nocardioides marinquilinus]|uniref:TfoX/Sxy family protein n=1 Tax=Nocardioides marinquilinus TaxID=1210400 RepID=UPI0031EEE717